MTGVSQLTKAFFLFEDDILSACENLPEWMKKNKIINSMNCNDNMSFQKCHAILSHFRIKKAIEKPDKQEILSAKLTCDVLQFQEADYIYQTYKFLWCF